MPFKILVKTILLFFKLNEILPIQKLVRVSLPGAESSVYNHELDGGYQLGSIAIKHLWEYFM